VIKRTIETDVKIYNFLTNQTEILKLIFDPSANSPRSSYYPKETASSFSLLDGIITVICLLVLLLVLNQFKGQRGTLGA